jgi:dTDP-3-amino-3,4,6-trideoxy-alpha-D-glucose transaminase
MKLTMSASQAERIPLARIDDAHPELMEELLATVRRVAQTGQFVGGQEVPAFEVDFARYCETTEAVGVSSGTEALVLGLRALGVGAGDEVVVPANSHIATADAVTLAGAVPRFADVDPVTHVVTAETVERALSPRVRAVIVVHLYGRTVDLDPICELVDDLRLRLVEDACQAHGARYKGRRVGSFGAFGAFSFYPDTNLGAWGDAGALTTSDREIADRVRLLRSHGERPRHHHQLVGTTARLDALQAAILRVKLARLDDVNDDRRRAARLLSEALQETDLVLPSDPDEGEDHVYHQFVVAHDDRDALRDHFADNGIDTDVHYPIPIHRGRAYGYLLNGDDPAPVATELAARICSLPIYPRLDSAAAYRIAAVAADMALVKGGA